MLVYRRGLYRAIVIEEEPWKSKFLVLCWILEYCHVLLTLIKRIVEYSDKITCQE